MSERSKPRKLESMLEAAWWRHQGNTLEEGRPRILILGVSGGADSSLAAMDAACREGVHSAGGQAQSLWLASELSFGKGTAGAWKAVAALADQTRRLVDAWRPEAVVVLAGDEQGLAGVLRGLARCQAAVLALPGPGSPWDPAWRKTAASAVKVEAGAESLEAWLANLERRALETGFGGAWRFPSLFRYLLEPLGLALPGATSAGTAEAARDFARRSGWQAVRQANGGVTLSQVLVPAAIRNALAVLASLGGSPAALWRLLQIFGELGVEPQGSWVSPPAAKDFCALRPRARSEEALRHDGGVETLMVLLAQSKAFDSGQKDASRRKFSHSLADAGPAGKPRFFTAESGAVPATRDWLLRGNLAPLGLIAHGPSQGGAVALPARVAQGEAAALELAKKGLLRSDEILVLRAPGARLAFLPHVLERRAERPWLLTDGILDGDLELGWGLRLPTPGGVWHAVKDGDLIKLDLAAGSAAADTRAGDDGAQAPNLPGPEWASELERLRRFGFS